MEVKKHPEQSVQFQYDNEQNKRLNEGRKFYKPFILRTPVLSALLLLTLVLIGLVELACRRLPDAPNRGIVTTISNGGVSLGIRQEPETTLSDTSTSSTSTSSDDGLGGGGGVIEVGCTEDNTVIPLGTPRTLTTSDVVDGTTLLIVEVETCGISTKTCPETSTNCFTQSVAPSGNWLIVGERRTSIIGGGGNLSPGVPPNVGGGVVTQPENGGNGGITPSVGGNNEPATVGNGQQGQDQTIVNGIATPVTAAGPTNSLAVATGVTGQGSSEPTATGIVQPSNGNTEGSSGGGVNTNVAGTIGGTTKPSATITTGPSFATSYGSIPTSGSGIDSSSGNSAQGSPEATFIFSNREYFTGAFLPTIIAILFTLPWGFVDVATKEIEPYVQLAKSSKGGAAAKHSLCLDYTNTPIIFMPFKSLYHGHGIVFLTSMMNIFALFTAPLAAESIFIGLRGKCDANTDANQCTPTLSVFRQSARALEGLLAIMAVCLILLIFLYRKRSSGVYSNPHSLAATASLFHNPPLVEVFRGLPVNMKESKLKELLRGHKYGVGYYPSQDGTMSYGFLLDPQGSQDANGAVEYSPVNPNDHISERPSTIAWRTTLLRFTQVITFILCLLGLLAVIMIYRFVNLNTGFERWMNSQDFGVRFTFTTLGVLICQSWYFIRSILHEQDPYHNLSKSPAIAQQSILVKPTPIPLVSIFRCLGRGAFILALTDFCTILCELLTIALANIPFSSGNTWVAFKVCFAIASALIILMILTLLLVLVRVARLGGGADVPKTLAGRMKLFVGSTMAEKFRVKGDVGEQERDAWVLSLEETYRFGGVTGWDGVSRLGIDFNEFVDARG